MTRRYLTPEDYLAAREAVEPLARETRLKLQAIWREAGVSNAYPEKLFRIRFGRRYRRPVTELEMLEGIVTMDGADRTFAAIRAKVPVEHTVEHTLLTSFADVATADALRQSRRRCGRAA
jgi:hypothetical protein